MAIEQFCTYPCTNPEEQADLKNLPPVRLPVSQLPRLTSGYLSTYTISRRGVGIDYLDPPYNISDASLGGLSDLTAHTDIIHYNGMVEFDVHNIYCSSMTIFSHKLRFDE